VGKLVYLMNVSLDGYIEAVDHGLGWARIDEELHTWFNEELRRTDASLYGRRLYEVMAAYWPTAESDPAATDVELDFARSWLETPKIVFSSTLETVDWNSRLVRGDPVDALARLRKGSSQGVTTAPRGAATWVGCCSITTTRCTRIPSSRR